MRGERLTMDRFPFIHYSLTSNSRSVSWSFFISMTSRRYVLISFKERGRSMDQHKEQLRKRIEVAAGKRPADKVIKNGRVIDVFNQRVMEKDIAILDGLIVGLGSYDSAAEIVDAGGKFVAPGFIDGHVHMESSMVRPSEFAKVALSCGVTSVVTDPHEIANVCGKEGIQFMMDDAADSLLDVYFMMPSCVPAASLEQNGAHLLADDLEGFYKNKQVLGLAEVMDFPAVASGAEDMVEKLLTASRLGVPIDGHGAGFDESALNIYKAAGITTDHECNTGDEALERIERGMHVLIRQGSASKDLASIVPVVNQRNAHRFLFCTDDKGLDELMEEGSIDDNVRLSIKHGIDPIQAVQMATINAAECYGLKRKGAVAPGYEADLVFFDDLENIQVQAVYKAGVKVAEAGSYVSDQREADPVVPSVCDTVHIPEMTEGSLDIPVSNQQATVIEVVPNRLLTHKRSERVDVENGLFVPSQEHDQCKLVVVERHKNTGDRGLGIVKGLKIENGAIVSTVAHDSHNLVAAGTSDQDILTAVHHLHETGGGLAVVQNGKVLASVKLEIAGLMSKQDAPMLYQGLKKIDGALERVLKNDVDIHPFLTLSFLTLPVIPELKLTTKGLFDTTQQKHIPVSSS